MIARAGDSGGDAATAVARQLDVAGALVHALLARAAGGSPAEERDEAIALLEELALPVAVLDATGRARLTNAAWRAADLARAAPRLDRRVGEVIRAGAAAHVPELRLGDGDPPACFAAALRPIRDGAGATTGVIVVCADVTDEVVARRLALPPGALVWGGPASGEADYGSGAFCAYTGAPARRPAWQGAIHAEDWPRCRAALGDAVQRGSAEVVEARVRRADGEHRWHRIRFVARAPGARWFGVATELADARAEELAAQLARERAARADAERASRRKDLFLAAISHELRTPLATMLLWDKVLRDHATDAAMQAQALEAIHQSALCQARLIGDLVDASRAISGKLELELQPLDLQGVLDAAIAAIAPAAHGKQIAIDRRGARGAVRVQGDGARLRKVLDNLLANAVKHTDQGGRITVAIARQARSIAIEIRDTGRGIAPEVLPHLFEPLHALDGERPAAAGRGGASRGRGRGLGLGLGLAKQIVELHRGELLAASDGPDRGATFTVKLPLAAARPERAPAGRDARGPSLDQIRLLVIDDDDHVRDALALLLDRAGAVVDTAASAEDARAKIAIRAPEALLCDIGLPDEDGNSFIRGLRASGRNIPAIALTGYTKKADAQRAIAAGFDLHVAKPVDFDHLVSSIGDLLAARRPARARDRSG